MLGEDESLKGREPRSSGLDDEQEFGASIQFVLPPVVRLDAADNVHAGSESPLQDLFGESTRHLEIGNSDKRDRDVTGGFHLAPFAISHRMGCVSRPVSRLYSCV